jgi:hypothetical protein
VLVTSVSSRKAADIESRTNGLQDMQETVVVNRFAVAVQKPASAASNIENCPRV